VYEAYNSRENECTTRTVDHIVPVAAPTGPSRDSWQTARKSNKYSQIAPSRCRQVAVRETEVVANRGVSPTMVPDSWHVINASGTFLLDSIPYEVAQSCVLMPHEKRGKSKSIQVGCGRRQRRLKRSLVGLTPYTAMSI
jgi:hypothetical protein